MRLTEEKLEELEKQWGEISIITVKGKAEKEYFFYLRNVDMRSFKEAMKVYRDDITGLTSGEILLRTLCVEGDTKELDNKKDERVLISAANRAFEMLQIFESDLKKK